MQWRNFDLGKSYYNNLRFLFILPNSIELIVWITLMLFAEFYYMSWLLNKFLQVPYYKVLTLIYGEELAESGCKFNIAQSFTFMTLAMCTTFIFTWRVSQSGCIILEIKKTPFDLSYSVSASLIPNCNRCCIILMIQSKKIISPIKSNILRDWSTRKPY
jgi:uncharacterized membrane protein SirB2